MNPLISIIVPVYNVKKTLNKCVDSVLNQNFHDWELLLVDDGSTDGVGEMCDEYAIKDQRIKVFHKKNEGVSSARNVGLDKAKGKWITFVDADDCIYENVFEIIFSHDEDILIFNYDINYNDTILSGEGIPSYYNSYNIKKVLDKYINIELFRTPWSKFYKKELINTLRFDSLIRIGEDTLFVLKYLQKCRSFFIFDNKYYIWSKDSISLKIKYKLSTEQAVYIVTCLYSEYVSLNIKCIEFERFIYDFYCYLCEDDLFINGILWFRNITIIQLWHRISGFYPMRLKILFFLKKYKFTLYFLMLCHQKSFFRSKIRD